MERSTRGKSTRRQPQRAGYPPRSHGVGRRGVFGLVRAALLRVALLGVGLLGVGLLATASGCEGGPEPRGGETAVVWRALEPPRPSLSTAAFPNVEIAGETRPVLGLQESRVLVWREPVTLAEGSDRVVPLPEGIAEGRRVALDAWVSVRTQEPGAAADAGAALQSLRESARRVVRDRRVVEAGGPPPTIRFRVPEALDGRTGLLSVVARPLPETRETSWETGAVTIPPGARLVFGVALEALAAEPGWPPVSVRVEAVAGQSDRPTVVFETTLDPARDGTGWRDVSVDLDALAGRNARLRFVVRALEGREGVAPRTLAVVSSPEILAPPSGAPRARNLVLISLDTLRAHSVGAYGSPLDTTPTFDRMAAEGALVRQAVSPFPFTPPAHMSMLTGLDPCMHGVVGLARPLPANRITLAEHLRAAGYRTAAFTENAYVSASAGFARGFDRFFEKRDEQSAAPGFAREIFSRGAEWVSTQGGDPFFLFLHTYEVHDPYTPPARYAAMFDDAVLHGPGPQREALRAYEAEIRFTDDLLADFLEALDASGRGRDTLVVVTSDHGEAFGEHLVTGHGYGAHDESVLVPLALRAPGLIAPGTVVEAQIGLADLPPTLLELVGLEPPQQISGQSFAGLLTGAPSDFEERPILIQTTVEERVAVRTRRYKYIQGGGPALLHALESDPRERRRAGDPALLAEARLALAERRAECEAWSADHPPEPAPRPEGRRAPGWLVNRDEIDAQLRALGYAE